MPFTRPMSPLAILLATLAAAAGGLLISVAVDAAVGERAGHAAAVACSFLLGIVITLLMRHERR
jgi:hypothetical protein